MTRRSPLVRRMLLGTLALAITTPALASCGFNYATNRVNTISMGIDERTGEVEILGAVIVTSQPGSGTFVSTLVNSDPAEATALESLAGDAESGIAAEDFAPIEIAPRGRVTLPTDGQVSVRGEFGPGDFVSVQLAFANGEQTVLDLPVVPGCRQWEGLDSSEEALALQPEAANPENRDDEALDDVPETELLTYECEPAEAHSE